MATISEAKLHALTKWLADDATYAENELNVLRINRNDLASALSELLTARAYIRYLRDKLMSAIDAADDRAMALLEKDDEIRELKKLGHDAIVDLAGKVVAHKEALRWIWADAYTPERDFDGGVFVVHTRQILAAAGLPAPEQK